MVNWFTKDKQRLSELEARMEQFASQLLEKQQEIERKNAENEELRQQVTDLTEIVESTPEVVDHQSSTEPWVEVKSERIDPVKGLVIELDWNEAFVQYLKDNGLTGRDDDTIVQKWLAMMCQETASNLEERSIDNSDTTRVRDFE